MCTARVNLGAGVAFFLRGNSVTQVQEVSSEPSLSWVGLPGCSVSPDLRDRLSSKKPTKPAMWAETEQSRVG